MLDFIYILLLIFAIYNGVKNGAVVTLFSFLAIFIGLIVAFKFSYLMAGWINQVWNTTTSWLPHIAFLIVFILTIIIVKLLAQLIKKFLSAIFLGWIDKIIGIIINIFCYTIVYAAFLFYANTFNIIPQNLKANSTIYQFLEPFGKGIVAGLSHIFVWLKQIIN
ncbi:MAG: CvpA family protein [Sediminibacterium sp.]|nr:CvpA family protein [Sediminibacterium sp.]